MSTLEITDLIIAASSALAFIATLVTVIYKFGKQGQSLERLAVTVDQIDHKLDGTTERVARIEGRMNGRNS